MEMDAPPPRLCHVTKWEDFDGYGFNLHAERNKLGQFIGKVDPNSPAEAAGLCEGDKIIEVNGVNISQENHKQVVQRIKAVKEETRLLVVDTKTEIYHKEKDIIITSSLPYVQHLSSDKHFEYIDTRIQTPSVPTLEHMPSVKGRNSPVGGRDSPAEGRDSPTGGRDSPDSVASLDEIPLDHRDVKREDSSSSERTLSNRSSLSSIGKQTKTVEDNMKAGKEDDKMENGGFSKDSPDEKIPQSPELADLPEAPEMPKLLQAVEITARTPSPSAPSPPSPSPPRSRASSVSSADEHELKTMEQEKIRNAAESSDSESDKDDRNVLAVSKGPNSVSSGSPRSTPSPQGSGKWTGREGGLDLPMTAREMRERIASMKKKDKRVEERMDFKKKYEIIKTL